MSVGLESVIGYLRKRTSSTPLLLLDCAHMWLVIDEMPCADPGEGGPEPVGLWGKASGLGLRGNVRTVIVHAGAVPRQMPTGGMRLPMAILVPSPAGRAQAFRPTAEAPWLWRPFSWICARHIVHQRPSHCAQSRRRTGEMRFFNQVSYPTVEKGFLEDICVKELLCLV